MRFHALLVSCLFMVSSASADEIRGSFFQSGNWTGAAYTYDDGTFSHCAMSSPYVSGDTLYLSITEDASIVVGFESPRLYLTDGAEYSVRLSVDRRYTNLTRAVAFGTGTAFITLTDFERALDAIRFGNLLTIEGNGFLGEYALSGTAVGLNHAFDCAVNYLHYTGPNAQPTTPQVAADDSERIDRTYLFQAATLSIAELGLTDFQYFSEAEMDEAGAYEGSVYWFSESAAMMGGVFIELADGMTLRQSDASDTELLAAQCDGDFATSARDLDGYTVPAREIRLLCLDDDQPHEVRLTKLLVGDLILYSELRFFDPDREVANARDPHLDSEAVAQRLASFALQ